MSSVCSYNDTQTFVDQSDIDLILKFGGLFFPLKPHKELGIVCNLPISYISFRAYSFYFET